MPDARRKAGLSGADMVYCPPSERAAPYVPAIVNALGFGIPMYEPVWLETDFLREYFLFKAEPYLPHIRFLKKKGYRF